MRYFYQIRSGDHVMLDEEGSEHHDLAAARAEAIIAAREIMAEAVLKGRDVSDQVFDIHDEEASVVAVVPFRDAIRPAA